MSREDLADLARLVLFAAILIVPPVLILSKHGSWDWGRGKAEPDSAWEHARP